MRINIVLMLVKAFLDGVKPLKTYLSRLTVPDASKKGRVLQVVLIALLIFSFAILLMMAGFNYYTYQTLGVLLDIPYLGMFLASLVGFFFLFLVGSIGLSSIIYRGKDITLVTMLPVSEVELLVSRLLIAYILYAPLYMVIVFPGILIASFLQGVSFLFVLGGLALLLLGPLLPLSLALFMANILVRLSKGKRFRMLEQLFSALTVLSLSLVMITTFTRNIEEGSTFQVDFQAMMLTVGTSFRALTKVFPLFMMQAKMLWSYPALLLQVLGIIIFSSGLCLIVGRGYARSLSVIATAQGPTRKRGKKAIFRQMSPTRTLMVREVEVIRGQSVFMIELVGELLLPFILLGVYALTGVLSEIEGMASIVAASPYLPYGLFFAVALLSSISMLSSTSVSRQGPLFSLDRVVPLRPEQFIKAKLLLHLFLVGVSSLLYLVISLLFFRLTLTHLIWMVPLALLVVFCNAAYGLAIDYKRPLLNWSIPQQAMKSNMNGLLGMGASLGVLAALGIAMFVPLALGSRPTLGISLSFIAAIVLCFFAWKTVVRNAYSAFSI